MTVQRPPISVGMRAEHQRSALLVLLAGTACVYWQVSGFELVHFDDGRYVASNAHLHTGLSWTGVQWAFTTTYFSNWHPLTWLSYLLDFELYGLAPGGYHLTNLALHLANTGLLFAALRRLAGAPGCALAVAALFALHPLHVESVAWVSERKDVLSGLFWMGGLWAYARYAEAPSPGRYAAVGGLLALGLLSKPMLVTFPCVLLLLDFWPLRRLGAQPGTLDRGRIVRCSLEKLPLLALSAAACAVTLHAQSGALQQLDVGLPARVANACIAYATYVGLAFWPVGLTPFYVHPGEDVSWPLALVAACCLAAVTSLALLRSRRHPYAAVGWLWFLGTLVPVIGLVQVGEQAMADRYTYVPLIGLSIALVWLGRDAWERFPRARATGGVLATAGGLALCACAWVQIGHWRDSHALFEHALSVDDANHLAHTNLGAALGRDGSVEEGLAHYARALDLEPETYALRDLLERQADVSRDLERYRAELETDPGSATAHYNLGATLWRRGVPAQAIPHFERATEIAPGFIEAHLNLGSALFATGNEDEGLASYRAALALDPAYAPAHFNLGLVRLRQGEAREAIPHFEAILSQNPSHPDALHLIEEARGMLEG